MTTVSLYLGLTPIHERRIRGDPIQLFKFNNGFNEVSWVNPLVQSSSFSQTGPARGIRGHKRRLSGQPSTKCMQRSNFSRTELLTIGMPCLPKLPTLNQSTCSRISTTPSSLAYDFTNAH